MRQCTGDMHPGPLGPFVLARIQRPGKIGRVKTVQVRIFLYIPHTNSLELMEDSYRPSVLLGIQGPGKIRRVKIMQVRIFLCTPQIISLGLMEDSFHLHMKNGGTP